LGTTQALPLGLWSADAIVAVSPTYADEMLSKIMDWFAGFPETRRENLTGILNGLDVNSFNPATDESLLRSSQPSLSTSGKPTK